jgi:two-component system LytT family response regulator
MLRVALIDDEGLARQGLRHLLAAHPNFHIIGEADSMETALDLVRREMPDAIFLDVRMPGASGFDLLKALVHPPRVVMVTAHSEHAIQAFEIEAVDYLLKPVSPSRFAQAIRRIEAACSEKIGDPDVPTHTNDDRICLRTPQRTIVVPFRFIPALIADGDFTRIHFTEAPPLMICQSLGDYEKLLPSPPFVRIDRSQIVNLETIIRLDRKSRDSARLVLEGLSEGLELGRTAQQRLRDCLPLL